MPGGKMSISNKPQGVGSPNQRAVRVKMNTMSGKQPPRLIVVSFFAMLYYNIL
jgi:hypothetical protein